MATKNFTQFNTASPLTTSDYVVGYNAAGTTEIRTQVQSIVNLVSDSDSQTLSYNETDNNLTISSGNTVSLSGLLPTSIYQSASGFWQEASTLTSQGSANTIVAGGNTKNANITIGTNDAFHLRFETNNNARMTILSSGEVGIGTTIANTAAAGAGGLRIQNNLLVGGTAAITSTLTANNIKFNNTLQGSNGFGENATAVGSYNTAVGQNALSSNIDTAGNTAIGYSALRNLTGGDLNIAVGYNSLLNCITGTGNIAIGANAAYFSNGYNNIAIGVDTLRTVPAGGSFGSDNTAIGNGALSSVSGGSNTALGFRAGELVPGGNSNIFIGVVTTATKAVSGSIAMGRNATITNSNQLVLGSPSWPLTGGSIMYGGLALTSNTAALSTVAGTSDNWNSTYTTVQSNSANWNTAYSAITGTTQLYTYYVSPSGNNSNPGTEALPLSTVNHAVQLAGNNDLRVILTSGTFVNQQIDLSNLRSLEVIGDQNGRTIIRNGTTFSDWTLHSGSVYKTTASPEITSTGNAYSPSTLTFFQLDTAVNTISAIVSLPPQHGRSYRLQHAPIIKSSSLNDILSGANGRWWFENNEIYFKTYDGSAATGKSLHASHPSLSGSFIYNGNGSISKVTVSNIEIVGANIGIDLSYVRQADISRTIVFGTTVYGVYGLNSGAVNIRNCEFAYTGDDSINFKGDQNNIPVTNFQNRDINVYDCWVHDAIDKGLVAHERTTINIYGGLFEYNTQAGIMAFAGGEVYMNGVTTRGHATQGTEITGSISASEGGVGTIVQALNCVSLQDRIGYRVNPSTDSSKTKLDLVNCTIDAPTLAGIYTTGQSTTNHKLNATGINLTTSGQLITTTTNASATVNFQNATVTRSSTPEGNVTAPVGTIARVTSGGLNTTLYVKVSGNLGDNTGWRGLVTQ